MQPGAAALAFGAGALVALAAALILRRGARRLPAAARALLGAVPDALGDAALLLDADGFVVAGNAAAVRLAGLPRGRLAGARAAAVLGEDLAILQRGVARGPCAARVTIRTPSGPAAARAAVARVGARPPRDLVVLRLEPAPPRPPPLPAATPPPPPPVRAAARADLAAVAAALRDPATRAATAASMLRLLLPSLPAGVAAELERLEAAVEALERRVGAFAAADAGGRGEVRAVDLAALVSSAVAALPASPVRVRATLAPVRALVDEARVRAALGEVLRALAEALPAGAALAVAVARRGAHAAVELTTPGGPGAGEAGAAAVARALLGPEGARVEVEVIRGRGRVCRLSFPALPMAPGHADVGLAATGPSV